jgi:hypothetical protein
MTNKNATYLGDGVYADFDGYQIWIWTSDGYNFSQRIAIDDYTLEALIEYAKRCRAGEVSIRDDDDD